jgi:hypothetical protein
VQLAALLAVLYVPTPQLVQARSLVADPAVLTYWPALQVVQPAQLSWFLVVV